MVGIFRQIQDDIVALWDAGWTTHAAAVPAYWRRNDARVIPEPRDYPHFFRNEVDFGRETILAFGGGRNANLRAQFGSVLVRSFVARSVRSEDTALDLMADAVGIFRSARITDALGNDLSFVGEGSGFDVEASEDGNWFTRGALIVFEYRFTG